VCRRLARNHSLFANTQFMGVCYHPTGLQVVTTGSDCKIAYWEVYDGSLVREIDGSVSGGLNAIDISRDGEHMLSGGNDQHVKVGLPSHRTIRRNVNVQMCCVLYPETMRGELNWRAPPPPGAR
jgi:WD40 repeat protein